jgi:hypothetical protein
MRKCASETQLKIHHAKKRESGKEGKTQVSVEEKGKISNTHGALCADGDYGVMGSPPRHSVVFQHGTMGAKTYQIINTPCMKSRHARSQPATLKILEVNSWIAFLEKMRRYSQE